MIPGKLRTMIWFQLQQEAIHTYVLLSAVLLYQVRVDSLPWIGGPEAFLPLGRATNYSNGPSIVLVCASQQNRPCCGNQ